MRKIDFEKLGATAIGSWLLILVSVVIHESWDMAYRDSYTNYALLFMSVTAFLALVAGLAWVWIGKEPNE